METRECINSSMQARLLAYAKGRKMESFKAYFPSFLSFGAGFDTCKVRRSEGRRKFQYPQIWEISPFGPTVDFLNLK